MDIKMKILIALGAAFGLSLGAADAWAADGEALCAAWKLRVAASRTARAEELAQGGLIKELGRGHGAETESALKRISLEIEKLQEKTRAVLERRAKSEAQWRKQLKDMGIEAIPMAKAGYREFAQGIIAILEAAAPGKDMGELKQELSYNPLSLSKIIPGPEVQAVNCGDTYLIYQPVAAGGPGSQTGTSVTLGDLWKNVTGK